MATSPVRWTGNTACTEVRWGTLIRRGPELNGNGWIRRFIVWTDSGGMPYWKRFMKSVRIGAGVCWRRMFAARTCTRW